MAEKNTAVFGIYRDRQHVETGVDQLFEAGFRGEDIVVLLPDNPGTKNFAHEKHTRAPESGATGTTTSGVMGALAGLDIPEQEIQRYEGVIKGGRVLLSVQCGGPDWMTRAKEILQRTGAENIASKSDKARTKTGSGGAGF
jgi:hypothetical protein